MHGLRAAAMMPVRIIEHRDTGETRVMGYDHPPYSHNPCGAPDAVVLAVRGGFGLTVPEFDMRTFEWQDETLLRRDRVQHSN